MTNRTGSGLRVTDQDTLRDREEASETVRDRGYKYVYQSHGTNCACLPKRHSGCNHVGQLQLHVNLLIKILISLRFMFTRGAISQQGNNHPSHAGDCQILSSSVCMKTNRGGFNKHCGKKHVTPAIYVK